MNKKILILDIILALIVAGTFSWLKFIKPYFTNSSNVSQEVISGIESAPDAEDIQMKVRAKELDEWYLILVNPDKAMPDDFSVETAYTEGGYEVDARIKDDLEEMLADCRDAGYDPQIISAFRTRETQQFLYDRTANKNDTAIPGHSEHECGLAVDIIDSSSAGWADPLIDEQEELPAQKWLMENCQNYGFILRYPKDKEDITQIIYEPWHYRYVGKEHAEAIMKSGICLEEYIEKLSA